MSQSCYCQCLAYHLHALTYGVDGDLTLGVDGYRVVTGWLQGGYSIAGGSWVVTGWLQHCWVVLGWL